MKVILFSDIHYSLDRTIHGRSPKETLHQAIDHACLNHGDAALCIIPGDLTDSGLESEYRGLAAALERLSIPFRTLLGNHDNRSDFIRVFGTDSLDKNGFVQSTAALSGAAQFP